MPWTRLLRALFVVYVAAALVHVGWILAHEPFSFDAWHVAVDTHGRPFSFGNLRAYWWLEYTHSNPRLGQALTYLAYKVDPFAQLAAPLAYLAISLSITVLALGRWPWRRGRDLALWAFVIGAMWFALPELGKTLFNRAYGANYVWSAAIQLAFLVPLRLRVASGRAGPVACAAYGLFGLAAGMCNEHTGPTFAAGLVVYAWWLGRRRGERATLVWAGAAGFLVGFAAILFAPGQSDRYGGIAEQTSMFGRFVQHGVIGNLAVLRGWLVAAAPTLALIAIVLVVTAGDPRDEAARAARRAALRWIALAIVLGTAIAATLFVSPKQGSRFYLVPASLLLASFGALVDAVLTSPRRLAPLVAIAVFASGYAAARTVPLYARVHRASAARLAALEAAPRGSVAVVDAFEQVDESWWFYGDDLRDSHQRQLVAHYLDLAGVVLRSYEPSAPLGVSTARLVPHARTEPPEAADDLDAFALGPVKAFVFSDLRWELEVAVAALHERLGTSARLDQLDIAVELADPHAQLPRRRVLAARWRPGGLEAYEARLVRHGRSFTRSLVLPAQLRATDRELYAYRVGDTARRLGTARDASLRLVPWGGGVYWVLACGATECFVIAGFHQPG